jgi:hypothetical protein
MAPSRGAQGVRADNSVAGASGGSPHPYGSSFCRSRQGGQGPFVADFPQGFGRRLRQKGVLGRFQSVDQVWNAGGFAAFT